MMVMVKRLPTARKRGSFEGVEGVASAVAVGHRALDVVREPVHEVSRMPAVPARLAPRVPVLELASSLCPIHCARRFRYNH